MHRYAKIAALAGFVALAACSKTPAESAADNVEQAYDNSADTLDAMADNTANDTASDMMENSADAMREKGDNVHDAIENGAIPANGM